MNMVISINVITIHLKYSELRSKLFFEMRTEKASRHLFEGKDVMAALPTVAP